SKLARPTTGRDIDTAFASLAQKPVDARRSRRLGRNCRGGVTRSDYCHLAAYQIGCEVGQLIVLVLRPAILDRHILAFHVAGFTNALPECSKKECTIGRPQAAEESDYWHRWLLRPRRERPRRRRAAEQGDERAAPHRSNHSITSSARPSNGSGTVMPSALAVLRLRNISIFVDCCTASSPGFSPFS